MDSSCPSESMNPGADVLLLAPSLTSHGGGIELYLRQFLEALAVACPSSPLHAVLAREPKLARPELFSEAVRARLTVSGSASESRGSRIGSFVGLAALAAARHRPELVVCGHVNYAALSHVLARSCSARMVALTYGIEAWNISRPLATRALRRADRIVAISSFTAAQLIRSLGV